MIIFRELTPWRSCTPGPWSPRWWRCRSGGCHRPAGPAAAHLHTNGPRRTDKQPRRGSAKWDGSDEVRVFLCVCGDSNRLINHDFVWRGLLVLCIDFIIQCHCYYFYYASFADTYNFTLTNAICSIKLSSLLFAKETRGACLKNAYFTERFEIWF